MRAPVKTLCLTNGIDTTLLLFVIIYNLDQVCQDIFRLLLQKVTFLYNQCSYLYHSPYPAPLKFFSAKWIRPRAGGPWLSPLTITLIETLSVVFLDVQKIPQRNLWLRRRVAKIKSPACPGGAFGLFALFRSSYLRTCHHLTTGADSD